MKLYDYFRSTACYRVRIALYLKGIAFDLETVHLVNDGGQQHSETYQSINPHRLVPSLALNDSDQIHQSLAIIEYLDEKYPDPQLLPHNSLAKAKTRSLAYAIACDIHPLNNLRVLQYLQKECGLNDEKKMQWYHHWLAVGFTGIEQQLSSIERQLPVCCGDQISLADLCLIPQVYNANRFGFALDDFPTIKAINAYCLSLEAFKKAQPEA